MVSFCYIYSKCFFSAVMLWLLKTVDLSRCYCPLNKMKILTVTMKNIVARFIAKMVIMTRSINFENFRRICQPVIEWCPWNIHFLMITFCYCYFEKYMSCIRKIKSVTWKNYQHLKTFLTTCSLNDNCDDIWQFCCCYKKKPYWRLSFNMKMANTISNTKVYIVYAYKGPYNQTCDFLSQ